MKKLGNFVKWFFYITIGILIVCGISYRMEGVEMVTTDIFWMILLSGFVTTLVTILLLPREADRKAKSGIKFALHYVALCVIMCFLGERFGWVEFSFTGIIGMAIRVGLVYFLAFMAYYIIDIKQASDINKRLQEKYGEEEL